MKLYVGTSGYSYKEWKGSFYPERIPEKDMLRFYSERMNSVEINSTFYRMPTPRTVASWIEQVPDDFVFSVKAPQRITHVKRLANARDETEFLFESLSALGPRLGCVLFQPPKTFLADRSVLADFLRLIPEETNCAFAFRSPSWIDEPIIGMLRERRCGLCIEDRDEHPADSVISTTSWGYLRLRRRGYDDTGLSHWAKEVLRQEWDRAFVFFEHEDKANGPVYAARFRELAG